MLSINSRTINDFLNNEENKKYDSYKFIENKKKSISNSICLYFINSKNELNKLFDKIVDNNYSEYFMIRKIIQIYTDESIDKLTENEIELIDNFLGKIIKFLPEQLHKIIKSIFYLEYYITSKSYIKSDRNQLSKPEDFIIWMEKNYWNSERMNLNYIPIIKNLGILKIFNTFFNSIYQNKEKQEKIILLYGKLGSGKTTILCMLLGIFYILTNKKPSYHKISNNNRGTKDFEIIDIEFDNFKLRIIDIIGFGDPGKGYDYELLWRKLILFLNYKNILNKIDIILYVLDGSIPRLDKSETNSLKLLMNKMFLNEKELKENSNYEELDYWKKVIIICSKSNDIKILNNRINGGLPKYNLKLSADLNQDILNEYNERYFDSIKEDMMEWRDLIESRKNEKLSYQRTGGDNEDQSFLVNFKRICKKLYPRITDSKINDLMIIITNNSVYGGTANRKKGSEIWDYSDCFVPQIPDFDLAINNDLFFNSEYEITKKSKEFIITNNWFNDLMNKIIKLSDSNDFKLNFKHIDNSLILDQENNETINNIITERKENVKKNKSFCNIL